MNGMINRAIERFVRDSYGRDLWLRLMRASQLTITEFEPMMSYEETVTDQVLTELARALQKTVPEVLEDIGIYLASHPNVQAVRRLLRFGGPNFAEFLVSLEDLPARARLALATLVLPEMTLYEEGPSLAYLHIRSGAVGLAGFGHVFVGVLQAMADDYGALVMLEHMGTEDGVETLRISLADVRFGTGRSFRLGDVVA